MLLLLLFSTIYSYYSYGTKEPLICALGFLTMVSAAAAASAATADAAGSFVPDGFLLRAKIRACIRTYR